MRQSKWARPLKYPRGATEEPKEIQSWQSCVTSSKRCLKGCGPGGRRALGSEPEFEGLAARHAAGGDCNVCAEAVTRARDGLDTVSFRFVGAFPGSIRDDWDGRERVVRVAVADFLARFAR